MIHLALHLILFVVCLALLFLSFVVLCSIGLALYFLFRLGSHFFNDLRKTKHD